MKFTNLSQKSCRFQVHCFQKSNYHSKSTVEDDAHPGIGVFFFQIISHKVLNNLGRTVTCRKLIRWWFTLKDA